MIKFRENALDNNLQQLDRANTHMIEVIGETKFKVQAQHERNALLRALPSNETA
jgi:hypothetical protein